jgi:hypothetical protein
MKTICSSSLAKKFLNDQSGQVIAWFILGFMTLIAVAGLVIDGGQAYADHAILQNSADAAALAAAGEVYNNNPVSGAVAYGTSYSGSSGDNNVNGNMPGVGSVKTLISPVCLNVLMPTGESCPAVGSSNYVPNAVHAFQSNTVNTYFMKFFGVPTLTIGAEATASMQGLAQKWNVAIILDATPSMNSKDSYCTNTSYTSEQCAMAGIRVLLGGMSPCSGGGSCTSSSAYSVFRVSSFTFPNVTTATIGYDTTCSGSKPAEEVYSLPVVPTSTSTSAYTPFTYTTTGSGGGKTTSTYQVTASSGSSSDPDANGFSSDYFSPGATNNLNSSSILVKAVGDGTTNGCLTVPATNNNIDFGSGGVTYFASAIYAAQTALQAEKSYVDGLDSKATPSKNAIIFVSDGQANTQSGVYPQQKNDSVSPTTAGLITLTGTGVYPDSTQDCQQAIMASQAVQTLGTRFYAVAYGSESNGCVTDSEVIGGITSATLNFPITKISQVIPCMVMQDMASPGINGGPIFFYADGSSKANGCTDAGHSAGDLNSIFGAILASFSTPSLLPNNAS